MNNTMSLSYWSNKAQNSPTIKTSKVSDINDFSDYDKNFILEHSDNTTEILDLAAGTGITLNKYYDKVKSITAVEMFPQFSKFIVKSPNVDVITSNINDYIPDKQFDLILMFGVTHYFNREESQSLYIKYRKFLKPNGKLIVKHQFGVNEDVVVEGFSKNLNCDYFSSYRYINSEVELLKNSGYNSVDVIDIYPKECNRWENTHYFAIVSEI